MVPENLSEAMVATLSLKAEELAPGHVRNGWLQDLGAWEFRMFRGCRSSTIQAERFEALFALGTSFGLFRPGLQAKRYCQDCRVQIMLSCWVFKVYAYAILCCPVFVASGFMLQGTLNRPNVCYGPCQSKRHAPAFCTRRRHPIQFTELPNASASSCDLMSYSVAQRGIATKFGDMLVNQLFFLEGGDRKVPVLLIDGCEGITHRRTRIQGAT